jgi:Sugar (and other) transporter
MKFLTHKIKKLQSKTSLINPNLRDPTTMSTSQIIHRHADSGHGQVDDHPVRPNFYTVAVCIVASSGAFLFGLDVGITGGVVAMPSFQEKFFADVYDATTTMNTAGNDDNNAYCAYNNNMLSLFTSSFFLAGIVSSIMAAGVTSRYGRKASVRLRLVYEW